MKRRRVRSKTWRASASRSAAGFWSTPFRKITVNLAHASHRTAAEKLEFLADGQQLVVDGIHPDTGKPYRWFGGEPWRIRRDELPYIDEREAQ
jgi:hypothetical protein